MTVRTETGIYWHSLAEALRRRGLDYISAPLNLTSSVGGTLGVGGIDINSPRFGCSADQALAGHALSNRTNRITSPVVIEDCVYIGGNCTIYPGIEPGTRHAAVTR